MVVLAALILVAGMMICTGGTLGVWLLSDKPLVSVTVQVASAPSPQVVLRQSARQVFT